MFFDFLRNGLHIIILLFKLYLLLLLLLSRFSRVRLCATPETAAHQAPPSLGFSRQEHWSGLPFCMKVQSESEVAQSCPTLSDPTDCSPPGSSVYHVNKSGQCHLRHCRSFQHISGPHLTAQFPTNGPYDEV